MDMIYGDDGDYKKVKEKKSIIESDGDKVSDEIYVINKKTHQIYFPHGIFAEGVMYFTF